MSTANAIPFEQMKQQFPGASTATPAPSAPPPKPSAAPSVPDVPIDLDSEMDVVGCIMHEPELVTEVLEVADRSDFWSEQARLVIDAALTVVEAGANYPTARMVIKELRHNGTMEKVGDEYIINAVKRIADQHNHTYYASLVKAAANRRRVVEASHRVTMAAQTGEDYAGAVAALKVAMDAAAPKQAKAFAFNTASEFDSLDLQREYHIEGVLAAGPVPTIFAGSFKTLKTSIAMDMLISLATGSRFLDHFPTKQTNVAVMSGESGGYALQDMARRVAQSKGWTLAGVGKAFRICMGVPSLAAADEMKQIQNFIISFNIGVFVIDPAYLAMRGMRTDDAANLFAVAEYLKTLAEVGQATGCTMILVHHNSRGATRASVNEPAELADIAWSGFSEWAGQWVLLARREKYDPDSNGEHRLWLTAGGRDGHSTLVGVNVTEGRQEDPQGRRWEVGVEQASKARSEAIDAAQGQREAAKREREARQIEADKGTIRQVLSKINSDTKTGIRERTTMNPARFNAAFVALLDEGIIEASEVGKGNGQKYDGFRLSPGLTRTHQSDSVRPSDARTHPDSLP